MKLLIVEDEGPKREQIAEFARSLLPASSDLWLARSVRTAIESLQRAPPDLVLLDMSLPTFDVRPGEPGGRPQGFGGIEVMRYMELYEINCPVVVITAYEAFSRDGREFGLKALSEQLAIEHPRIFRGIIYYNSLVNEWREELRKLLDEFIGNSR